MKKKVVILVSILLIALVSFVFYSYYINNVKGKFFEANNTNGNNALDKVTMTIKEGTLTSATIVIKNASNKELTSRRMV